MTALAGIWRFGSGIDLEAVTSRMIAAQRGIAPDGDSILLSDDVAFGRGIYRLLPEDDFDSGVWSGPGGRLFVADSRIDNREELLAELGLGLGAPISDSELLFRAWEAWRERALDRLIGDFAFAAWDPAARELILARDPTGQRPLHYHRGEGRILFASTAGGIHAAGVEARIDRRMLAEFVADIPRTGSGSFFQEIERVEPGQIVRFSSAAVQRRSFWQFPARQVRFAADEDYVEAYREQLDRAVRVRLRGAGRVAGAHLSCGLDSGAVAATSARIQRGAGGAVTAFTSAPRSGFDGPLPRGRIGDESMLAAEVAALHANMEHVVIRPGAMTPLDLIARDAGIYDEPLGLPCNQVWLSAVSDEAHARGIRVMMVGSAGNHTISAGGIGELAELVRAGQWVRWMREAQASRRRGLRYRGIAMGSFGPWLPQRMWRGVKRIFTGPSVASQGAMMLGPELREQVADSARSRARGAPPPRSQPRMRWQLLQAGDPGNFRKGVLGRWGIDERDPTTDRRLAEFCLSLPADQLIRDGVTRRIARLGLADRLPPSVLHGPRGYQGADWYESVSRERVGRSLDELAGSEAADLLDLPYLRRLVDEWPRGDWASGRAITTYRMALLRALAAAQFARSTARRSAAQ